MKTWMTQGRKQVQLWVTPEEERAIRNCLATLRAGITDPRAFGRFLRDAGGFSRSQAVAIAGHGFRRI